MNGFEQLAIEIVVKSSLIILAAWALSRLARRANSALAHFVMLVGLVSSVFLPIFALVSPLRYSMTLPAWVAVTRHARPAPSIALPSTATAHVDSRLLAQMLAASVAKMPSPSRPQLPQKAFPWPSFLLAVWTGGVVLVIARYAHGLWRLHHLRRHHTQSLSDHQLLTVLTMLRDRGTPSTNWELRVCANPEPATAMTWGLIRPVVLLPQEADQWSPKRLEAVLLHELAHVRRRDFASQALAESVCAFYWFNPLVWLGARALRADAELAADDTVLRSGLTPSTYAQELLMIAAELGKRRQLLARVGISAMTSSKIEYRLQSVLSAHSRRRGLTTVQALVAVAIAGIAAPSVAALRISVADEQQRPNREVIESKRRLADLTHATIAYAKSHNQRLPVATTTTDALNAVAPYVHQAKSLVPATHGGKVIFNVRYSNRPLSSVLKQGKAQIWTENLVEPKPRAIVAFANGNTKTIQVARPITIARTYRTTAPTATISISSPDVFRASGAPDDEAVSVVTTTNSHPVVTRVKTITSTRTARSSNPVNYSVSIRSSGSAVASGDDSFQVKLDAEQKAQVETAMKLLQSKQFQEMISSKAMETAMTSAQEAMKLAEVQLRDVQKSKRIKELSDADPKFRDQIAKVMAEHAAEFEKLKNFNNSAECKKAQEEIKKAMEELATALKEMKEKQKEKSKED